MPKAIDTVAPVHEILTNVAIRYRNPAFIAEQLWPVVPVGSEKFTYFLFGPEMFKRYDTRRALSTQPKRIDYSLWTAKGVCEEYMLEHPIDDRIRAEFERPLDPEVQGTELLTDALRLDQEHRVASICTTSGNYHSDLAKTPSTKWNETGATIFEDITGMQEAIRKIIGVYPNTIVIPASVAQVMAFASEVTDYIKNVIGLERLERPPEQGWMLPATLFGMRVLIPGVVTLKTNLGQEDWQTEDVWKDHVVIAYVQPRPSLYRPSFGYTFRRRPFRVRTFRDENVKSDIIEASFIQAELVVGKDRKDKIVAAGLLYNVLA